jgi:Trk K+ transport system NAD-binding subunit
VEVYELTVPEAWRGRRLAELVAGVECAVVSLARGGRAALPDAQARLEAFDLLQVSASPAGATTLSARLFGEA